MKKILVAGAGGFIAGHLAKKLHEDGHEVVAVDKKPFDEWYQITEGVKSLVLDLRFRENCGGQDPRGKRIKGEISQSFAIPEQHPRQRHGICHHRFGLLR